MPTFSSMRKGKKCLSDHIRHYKTLYLHEVFFRFSSDFLALFTRILYFKFLEFKEFNKTIIPFALIGHETGASQLGAMRLIGYLPSHIQRARQTSTEILKINLGGSEKHLNYKSSR